MTRENRRANIATEWQAVHNCLAAGDLLASNGLFTDAVTRYYYACFHAARAAVLSRDLEPLTHTGVRTEFARQFVHSGLLARELGRILTALQKEREDADYQRGWEVSADSARQAGEDAHSFCETVRARLVEEGWLGSDQNGAGRL